MIPYLKILPKAQLLLWRELKNLPAHYVLYGGTAIALQLGHRQSVDFDFFSSHPLDQKKLLDSLAFLQNAKIVQPEINTLDCIVENKFGSVKFQFLAGIGTRQGRVEDPKKCQDNDVFVASLRDLLATKLNTIQARAEIKDYIDIEAILNSGILLSDGLACARAIFGPTFDYGTSLRALCSFRDGDLPQLSKDIQKHLTQLALNITDIPELKAKCDRLSPQ